MTNFDISGPQKKALGVATGLAVIFGVYFLYPYFLTIVFAAVMTFIFNPLYKRLRKHGWRPGGAATFTFLCSLLAMLIPLALVIFISVHEAISLSHFISGNRYSTNIDDLLKHGVDYVNHFLASLHVSYRVTVAGATAGLTSLLKNFGEGLLHALRSSVTGFFSLFTIAIAYIYVFLSLLIKQDTVLQTVHALNPLGPKISHLYVTRMAAMAKAMVRGQFVIALLQGLTDASLLYFAGLHNTFFVFFVLLTVLSIIPLGGGIVAIPIGVVLILTGSVWQGLLIIVGHIIIVTNIDNVLRPRLVPATARLDPSLTLLAVFAGLRFFGFLGIIIGPVLMILIVTTIQVFLEVYRDVDAVQTPPAAQPRHRWFRRVMYSKR